MTTHDFTIAGMYVNLILNPNAKDAEFWAKIWDQTPERVKKYVNDFKDEMKDYLTAREALKCTL